ncbi:MAG: GNAT family N-acetyltransferase [Candidatus Pacebacteria bacterium]|nr:GNAT family N-acetyltransferase [Candidatus Paceibacterota bacterium]
MQQETEKNRPFAGQIQVKDTLSIDINSLPEEAQQYTSLHMHERQLFFEAVEGGEFVGFAKIEISEKEGVRPEFVYRFIDPNHRRRGVGQKLRDKVYVWLEEQGYESVGSGINNVGTITDLGEIEPNLSASGDGGWKSYFSMTRAKEGSVKHTIESVTIDPKGEIDFSFVTYFNPDEVSFLPSTPEGLSKAIEEVLPEGETLISFKEKTKDMSVVVAENGRYYSILEWIRLHRN